MSTDVTQALKVGERLLRKAARDAQKALSTIENALRRAPSDMSAEARSAAVVDAQRLSRIARFSSQAITDLPADQTLRLVTIHEHLQMIQTLTAERR